MLSVAHGIGDQMVKDALNVLFLSPEVVPFAKSGGLADVAGSLPIALKRLGLDLLVQILDDVLDLGIGLVVLGSGMKRFKRLFSKRLIVIPARWAFRSASTNPSPTRSWQA